MASSVGSGSTAEKRSVSDKLKHPDLFPELRGKMKGRPSPSNAICPANILTCFQIRIYTKPKRVSTTSSPKSASSTTLSIPTIVTTKRMRRQQTKSAPALLNRTALSLSRQKETATRSSGMSTGEITFGQCPSRWRRPKRQSTSRTGG